MWNFSTSSVRQGTASANFKKDVKDYLVLAKNKWSVRVFRVFQIAFIYIWVIEQAWSIKALSYRIEHQIFLAGQSPYPERAR